MNSITGLGLSFILALDRAAAAAGASTERELRDPASHVRAKAAKLDTGAVVVAAAALTVSELAHLAGWPG